MVLSGEITATESAAPDVSSVRDVARRSSVSLAIDIVVRWGDWVVSAHELSPPRPFVVGEQDCDVLLPAEILGADRVPILLARWDGDVRLIVSSTARVLIGDQKKRMSAARCVTRGLGQPSTDVPGAAEVQLVPGQTITLFFKSVAIDVQVSAAAPSTPRRVLIEKRVVLAQLGSFVLHMMLLTVMSVFGPRIVNDDEGISDDQRFELQQRLERAAEREMEHGDDIEGYKWRARRNERRLLAALARRQDQWMEMLEANASDWTDELARAARRDEAPRGLDQGVIGVLYDWPTPAPTTRSIAATPRDTRPPTVTLPADTSPSRGYGPHVRMGTVTVSGRLPAEVIQRIVRQNFGRFRLCYENGLRNNPNLMGRVTVRFVIGRDGAVTNVSNGGSDLPDGSVVSCIARAFHGLTFPQPEGGIVTVAYSIMLAPGG
jgi:hypothetical protein